MTPNKVYVIGHRNPDTDSICSAMAYARLCQRQGRDEVQPARAGTLNKQTEFVLEELGLPVPQLLTDVHPRVADIIGEHVVTIPAEAPVSRAMELFHLHHVRQLPVVDSEHKPLGLLVLKRITERFLIPRQEADIRRVETSPVTLAACLKAEILHGYRINGSGELDLYVGAMDSRTFHQKLQGRDPHKMILLTGDREDIQSEAVEIGVRVLVVTGGLPVAPDIMQRAGEKHVTVLSTPFDTATSAWLTRLATPVGNLVGTDFLAVQPQDRVDDLRLKLTHSRESGAVVIDAAVRARLRGLAGRGA